MGKPNVCSCEYIGLECAKMTASEDEIKVASRIIDEQLDTPGHRITRSAS